MDSDPLLTLARKASVPIVLLGLPLGEGRSTTRVAVGGLVLMVAFAPWAWQLLGYF